MGSREADGDATGPAPDWGEVGSAERDQPFTLALEGEPSRAPRPPFPPTLHVHFSFT